MMVCTLQTKGILEMDEVLTYRPKSGVPQPDEIIGYPDGSAVSAGALPLNGGDKPVVVFVPGLGNTGAVFFDGNELFENAYTAGFRTAYVSFHQKGEKPRDIFEDGKILARQLEDICAFYHTKRVVVVAHSKGGVDAQTAAAFFGAADKIAGIVTLSTPHWGSQLADLAYSASGWALAELIKVHSPGCFSMQTGYMREYRKIADPMGKAVPIYTYAGNGGATELTGTWAGSLVLDRFGENDGCVTVESAHNPNGEHLATLYLNHGQMVDGRFIWQYLSSVLSWPLFSPTVAAMARPRTLPAAPSILAPAQVPPPTAESLPIILGSARVTDTAHIILGGNLDKGADGSFFVDSAAEKFTVTATVAGTAGKRRFYLAAPDGHKTLLASKKDAEGTTVLGATVANPQVGRWHLTSAPGRGAYCALVCLGTKKAGVPGRLRTDMRIIKTRADGYDLVSEQSLSGGAEPQLSKLPDGHYSLELHMVGELEDGSTYERSAVRPFAVGDPLSRHLSP